MFAKEKDVLYSCRVKGKNEISSKWYGMEYKVLQ